MGNWEDVKTRIQNLWYDFWGAVGQVINAIWQAIVFVVTKIVPAILIVVGGIAGVTAILAIFSPLVATAFVNSVVAITTGIVKLTATLVTASINGLVTAVDIFGQGFATIIDAINLDAILEIHEVLWILSDDYRALVGLLFDKISEVSEQLFGNGMILQLVFRSTRNLVLSTSAMLGRPYDLSQCVWFSTLDEILVKFNEKAEIYMNDPEQLFIDLEEWAEKNAIDIGGTFRQSELISMRGSLDFLKSLALQLNTFDRDYKAFTYALPGERGRAIDRKISPILINLGEFRFSSYERNRLETGYMIKDNKENIDRQRTTMSAIQWGTERPSRGFEKIEGLDKEDRQKEEQIIEDYSSRELGRDNEELVNQHDERITEEDSKKVKKELFLPPPSWETITEKPVPELEIKKSTRRTSPFVGDY